MTRNLTTITAFVAIGVVLLGSVAHSQSYPAQPIRIVVSSCRRTVRHSGAARVADLLDARPAGSGENRAGAGGALAAREVATAKPDGYTLLLGNTSTLAVIPEMSVSPDTTR